MTVHSRWLTCLWLFFIALSFSYKGQGGDVDSPAGKIRKRNREEVIRLLRWSERKTSDKVIGEKEIMSLMSGVEGITSTESQINLGRSRYNIFIKKRRVMIKVFTAESRDESDEMFFNSIAATNMRLEDRLSGFLMWDNPIGDYTYSKGGNEYPNEIIAGFQNVIFHLLYYQDDKKADENNGDLLNYLRSIIEYAKKLAETESSSPIAKSQFEKENEQHWKKHFESINDDVKRILKWSKRKTSDGLLSENDIIDYLDRIEEIAQAEIIFWLRIGEYRVLINESKIDIRVFAKDYREESDELFFIDIGTTNMDLKLRLRGFVMWDDPIGDFTYSNGGKEFPYEVIAGYKNIIFYLRKNRDDEIIDGGQGDLRYYLKLLIDCIENLEETGGGL